MTIEQARSIMQEAAILNEKYDIWDDEQRAARSAARTFTDKEYDEANELVLEAERAANGPAFWGSDGWNS